MASKKKDLRTASEDIEAVKRLAADMYGFQRYHVKPLEADESDPSRYCLFEVLGTRYEVKDGALAIVKGEE